MTKSYNNALYYQSSEWHVRFVIVTQISISRLDFYSRNKLKFIYSEKATKFCKISTVDLTVTTQDKSTVEISQKFVAFSEYMNFTGGTWLGFVSTTYYLHTIPTRGPDYAHHMYWDVPTSV